MCHHQEWNTRTIYIGQTQGNLFYLLLRNPLENLENDLSLLHLATVAKLRLDSYTASSTLHLWTSILLPPHLVSALPVPVILICERRTTMDFSGWKRLGFFGGLSIWVFIPTIWTTPHESPCKNRKTVFSNSWNLNKQRVGETEL